MPRLWITTLVAASLIALAVACSSSEDVTPQQAEPTSAPAVSAQAQPTEPPSTTAPAPTSAPSPAAAVSTSTSVPATVAPTSTSAPAPTAAPASPAPQSVATSDASAPATVTSEDEERDLEIVTLLPFDAIPAILEPEFVSAEVASEELEDHNLVLGLSINGDHRAYSIPTLSAHEIVNDTVGGKPVAVTW